MATNRRPVCLLLLTVLLGLLLGPASQAQLDESLARKGLKAAAKSSKSVYQDEVLATVLEFGEQLEAAVAQSFLDGYQPEDLVALVSSFDAALSGLRDDLEQGLQTLSDGARDALGAASTGPLGGQLPALFRIGGSKGLDKAVAKLVKAQGKAYRQLDKLVPKLEIFLAKAIPVTLELRLYEAPPTPVLALDETASFPVGPPGFAFDIMATAHEPHLRPAWRALAAGFADDSAGDVTVERLDLVGDVVDVQVVAPTLGRWLSVFELPGPGPVVLRARQGGAAVGRTLGAH